MKKRIAIVVAACASLLFGSVAIAADDPISIRKALMKTQGAAIGTLSKMAKGEMEFDAVAAMLAVRAMEASAYGFSHYFPKGSETGMETTAAPAIWEKMGDFEAAVAKFQADTTAAVANPPKTKEDLGPTLGALGANCGSCHKVFRIKKG